MATYTVTTSFSANTTAIASEVNQNFTDVLTALNALDAANLTGTIALARISNLTSSQMAAAFFKDEDDMASNSATAVASQQSLKKYVDDQIDTTVGSGAFNPLSESDGVGSAGVTVFANGFRMARGSESVAAGAEDTVSPSGFTAVYKAMATIREDNNTDRVTPKIGNYSGATFTIRNTNPNTVTYDWIAIGH